MGLKDPSKRIRNIWKKYRYPLLVLLVGIGLMLIPVKKDQDQEPVVAPVHEERSMEERLEEVLAGIEGVGKVDVLLSIEKGETVIYQTDEDKRSSDNDLSDRESTVIVTQSDRAEAGLVRQVDPPKYQGAVVVCQGAYNASVRLAVVDAVSKATGLGADRIVVVKMK